MQETSLKNLKKTEKNSKKRIHSFPRLSSRQLSRLNFFHIEVEEQRLTINAYRILPFSRFFDVN
jgi:hypothetical protein